MSKGLLIGLGVFLAVVVAGIFITMNPKTAKTPAKINGPVKEFNVSAKEFAYTPSTITVNKGDAVKINFANDGTTAHNFTISEFNVATKTISPGESDSITFTPTASGTYSFFCSVDSHRSLGLQGTLEVK